MKTIVVTGANSGIGRATARQLAQLGHRVVMVCRSESKGASARDDIVRETKNTAVDLIVGDLGTIAGTRAAAERILAACNPLNVLINNAGVWPSRRELNADGLESAFMVNHVAPFMLSLLLLERLKDSAPARIVNVNAGLYVKGEAGLDALPTGANFHRFKTYMHTKLLNVLFTVELARRIEGSGVTVNALHPGVINTDLGASSGAIGMLLSIAKRFWGTPDQGAAPVVALATAPEFGSASGQYFDQTKPIPIDPKALDRDKAQALWSLTATLTGVTL